MELDQDTKSKLTILKRQYFQLLEPTDLRWPNEHLLKAPNVQAWLFSELFNTEKAPHAPPERYQKRVLKLLISKLERSVDDPEEDEISDDLISALSSLMSSTLPSEATSAQQKAFVTYSFPSRADDGTSGDASVTLLESRYVISSAGTTGLRTWEAALHLGSFLSSERGQDITRGSKVIELGAGTGMLSILCTKHLGVSGMVATDGDEAVVDAVKTNVFLNGIDTEESSPSMVRTAALKWGWPVNASTFAEDYGMEVPDVLLGADVTYDRSVIPRLVSTLREFLNLNPALQVIIAATIRNEQTFETFLDACSGSPFHPI